MTDTACLHMGVGALSKRLKPMKSVLKNEFLHVGEFGGKWRFLAQDGYTLMTVAAGEGVTSPFSIRGKTILDILSECDERSDCSISPSERQGFLRMKIGGFKASVRVAPETHDLEQTKVHVEALQSAPAIVLPASALVRALRLSIESSKFSKDASAVGIECSGGGLVDVFGVSRFSASGTKIEANESREGLSMAFSPADMEAVISAIEPSIKADPEATAEITAVPSAPNVVGFSSGDYAISLRQVERPRSFDAVPGILWGDHEDGLSMELGFSETSKTIQALHGQRGSDREGFSFVIDESGVSARLFSLAEDLAQVPVDEAKIENLAAEGLCFNTAMLAGLISNYKHEDTDTIVWRERLNTSPWVKVGVKGRYDFERSVIMSFRM